MEYFPTFNYNTHVWKIITTQLQSLFDVSKNNSQLLESFCWKNYSDLTPITSPGIIVAELEDEKWICVCPTVYKETEIPEQVISRFPLVKETFTEPFTETTLNLISKIEKITAELGKIHLAGDFCGGYYYTYDHEIVYAVAESKSRAIEKALQTSGMLEIKKFHSFYPDEQDLEDWHSCYQINRNSLEYERVNQFFNQTSSEVMMYRVSFWTQENIYIIGKTECGDWAGLYIKSEFVYNP